MKYLICLFLSLTGLTTYGQVINPDDFTGNNLNVGNTTVNIADFRDLPYDYAKKLGPELYYWWALAHNERQWQGIPRTPAASSGVSQIKEEASVFGTSAPIIRNPLLGSGGGRNDLRSRRKTTIRYYAPPAPSGGPVIIYNPYFR